MTDISIRPDLVKRLEQIASAQHRAVDGLIDEILDAYAADHAPSSQPDEIPTHRDPLEALVGILDGETADTDLSVTVRETLAKHTHPQYGWTVDKDGDSA